MSSNRGNSLTSISQAGPAFPIELFESIACFVAGANDFGTLASLCATSSLMAQELIKVLYETVFWTDALLERLGPDQTDEGSFEVRRHIK